MELMMRLARLSMAAAMAVSVTAGRGGAPLSPTGPLSPADPVPAILQSAAMPVYTVAGWGISCTDLSSEAAPVENRTLRTIIELDVSGEAVRVQLSNQWGAQDLTVDHVTFAKAAGGGGAVEPDTVQDVLFSGGRKAVVPAGGTLWSDPLDFPVEGGGRYAVSCYLVERTGLASGNIFHADAYAALLPGDLTRSAEIRGTAQSSNFLVRTVDVCTTSAAAGAFVIVGDSISTNRWPALLQERLEKSGTADVSVICRAVSGNRLMTGGRLSRFGPSVISRWKSDALDTSGVYAVLLEIGANDLLHPAGHPESQAFPVEEMIAAEEKLIQQAHDAGIKVYMTTITPFNGYDEGAGNLWSPELEQERQTWNQWIRTNDLIDGYVDLCARLEDPADPTSLQAAYTTDHLHPSELGMELIASSLPLAWFTRN